MNKLPPQTELLPSEPVQHTSPDPPSVTIVPTISHVSIHSPVRPDPRHRRPHLRIQMWQQYAGLGNSPPRFSVPALPSANRERALLVSALAYLRRRANRRHELP
jgi:hypothetical protein